MWYLLRLFEIPNLIMYFLKNNLVFILIFYFSFPKISFLIMILYHYHFKSIISEWYYLDALHIMNFLIVMKEIYSYLKDVLLFFDYVFLIFGLLLLMFSRLWYLHFNNHQILLISADCCSLSECLTFIIYLLIIFFGSYIISLFYDCLKSF